MPICSRVVTGVDFFFRVSTMVCGGGFETALEGHGVGAGGHVLKALLDDGLGEDGRGGGAVAGDVVGLGGDLFGELGADVLEGLVELDVFGDGDAVIGDGGGAELLVEDDVAPLGAERDLHGVGEGVDPVLERLPGLLVEEELFSHSSLLVMDFVLATGDILALVRGEC